MNAAREALAELVACKDLKEEIDNIHGSGGHRSLWLAKLAEYDRRKPLAWEAARAALSAQAPPAPEGWMYETEKSCAGPFIKREVTFTLDRWERVPPNHVETPLYAGTPQADIGAQAESVSGPEPTAYPANWECIPRARVPAMSADFDPGLARKLLDVACRIRVGETLYRDDELVDEAAHALAALVGGEK